MPTHRTRHVLYGLAGLAGAAGIVAAAVPAATAIPAGESAPRAAPGSSVTTDTALRYVGAGAAAHAGQPRRGQLLLPHLAVPHGDAPVADRHREVAVRGPHSAQHPLDESALP